MNRPDPTQRFSDRAGDYVRYRPGYPEEVIDHLLESFGLRQGDNVADIGSGTGIFTERLLARNLNVQAVEPNSAMREAAEKRLRGRAGFESVDGSAEATTLPDAWCDAVVAAQAFHWFDRDAAKAEFRRILRPPGWCALIWNERLVDVDAFSRAYEQLLIDFGTDYSTVDHRQIDRTVITSFFDSSHVDFRSFGNLQVLDLEGLKGRLSSASYMPAPGHPRYDAMIGRIEALFHRHHEDGNVRLRYDTIVYTGRLG